MAKFLIWLSVFAFTLLPASLNTQEAKKTTSTTPSHWFDVWLTKFADPAVLVVLLIPAIGGVNLFFRASSQNTQALKRREFKDELIKELSTAIASEIRILQTALDLKIETISLQISYVSKEVTRHGELIQEMEDNLEILDEKSKEIKLSMDANFRHDEEFLSMLDLELSRVLSAYLNCTVEIKVFRACRMR